MRPLKGGHLWLFVARQEITVETFLSGEIFYTCDEDARPIPLVPPGAAPHPQGEEETKEEFTVSTEIIAG